MAAAAFFAIIFNHSLIAILRFFFAARTKCNRICAKFPGFQNNNLFFRTLNFFILIYGIRKNNIFSLGRREYHLLLAAALRAIYALLQTSHFHYNFTSTSILRPHIYGYALSLGNFFIFQFNFNAPPLEWICTASAKNYQKKKNSNQFLHLIPPACIKVWVLHKDVCVGEKKILDCGIEVGFYPQLNGGA